MYGRLLKIVSALQLAKRSSAHRKDVHHTQGMKKGKDASKQAKTAANRCDEHLNRKKGPQMAAAGPSPRHSMKTCHKSRLLVRCRGRAAQSRPESKNSIQSRCTSVVQRSYVQHSALSPCACCQVCLASSRKEGLQVRPGKGKEETHSTATTLPCHFSAL